MFFLMILGCTQSNAEKTDTQEELSEPTQETSEDSPEDTSSEEIQCPPLQCEATWNQENIALSFSNFDEQASYFFGMAQTGIDNPNVWTGEDCYMGFSTDEETFSYCHPARDGITLQYGASYESVVEGFSTHFAGSQFEDEVTYLIKDSISGCCWSWGNKPEYYQELGCNPLEE